MYSVVETKEKNRLVVTAVPTNWVIGDCLIWPGQVKNKVELDNLLRNENSVPGIEWVPQKCSVRASKIESYSLALTVEKAFLHCHDTDDEQVMLKEIIDNPKPSMEASVLNQKLKKLFETEKDKTVDKELGNNPIVIASRSDENDNKTPVQHSNRDEQLIHLLSPNIIKNITEVIHSELEKQLNPVLENICRLETKLDEVLKKFKEPSQCSQEQEDMSWCNYKFPLNTVDEVESLEKQLLSTSFYKKMAKYLLRKTCPKDTKDVKKVTKKVLDQLFTFNLLKSYSWTGRGNKKPAFSSLNTILNLILDIEKQADPTYNLQKSSDFLQNKCFKCLNQTIRRSELKRKSRILDDQVAENETIVLQEVVPGNEEKL